MTKMTIVYTDGHEEHYNIITPEHIDDSSRLKRFKDIFEDEMLKLIIEDTQIVFIPIANIRKIISQADGEMPLQIKQFPGFLNAKIAY